MATLTPTRSVLTDDILERCGQRAAVYDRENRFFQEDFDELRDAGYLTIAVPREFGGLGLSLAEVCREQRRLAYHAPATALGLTMHIEATGIAADLYRSGDTSQRWVLDDAARGEVFAYGVTEAGQPGNDLPVLYSTQTAERVEGGYRFSGHKVFTSLSPVWTRLMVLGMDRSNPDDPKVVHAFLPHEAPGWRTVDTWDTLGMRATRSDDTVLDNVFVPDQYVVRVLSPGFAGSDQYVLTIFAWFEPIVAHLYLAIAERARDLAIATVKQKSVVTMARSMAYHPEVQHTIADIVLELEAMAPHAERIADDWSNGVDHGHDWASKLVAVKHRCTEGAQKVVDQALQVAGGRGMFRGHELERLFRDVRCGGFHPAGSALVHEIVGQTALGVLGEPGPRWG
jgi:alkylation response protein AidB-like acyl-CoA dehydrogenase